jgi:hypothetical protein
MGYLARYRGIAGACALVSVLFYAALIPVHIVSEASTVLLGAKFADALTVICHSGRVSAAGQALADRSPGAPAKPQERCPFCQGYAAFQLAIAPANMIGIVRVAVRAPTPPLSNEELASARLLAPQSRGPPSFPT